LGDCSPCGAAYDKTFVFLEIGGAGGEFIVEFCGNGNNFRKGLVVILSEEQGKPFKSRTTVYRRETGPARGVAGRLSFKVRSTSGVGGQNMKKRREMAVRPGENLVREGQGAGDLRFAKRVSSKFHPLPQQIK